MAKVHRHPAELSETCCLAASLSPQATHHAGQHRQAEVRGVVGDVAQDGQAALRRREPHLHQQAQSSRGRQLL